MALYPYSVTIISILLEIRNRQSRLPPSLWYFVATILIFLCQTGEVKKVILNKSSNCGQDELYQRINFSRKQNVLSLCLVFLLVF